MLSLHLKELSFYAYHGLYEGEELLGSRYEVDCSIHFVLPALPVTELHQTANYVTAYECIRKNMENRTPLLETVLQHIEADLLKAFPGITGMSLTIYKCNPPIPGFKGKLGVSLQRQYDR